MSFPIDSISAFPLRLFQHIGAAKNAEGSLSASYSELVDMETLISWDSKLIDKLTSLSGAYPAIFGSHEIRSLVGDFLQVDEESIIITNGVDDAILSIYSALFREDDHISLIEPAYDPLIYNAKAQRAVICGAKLDEAQNGWQISQQTINRLVAPEMRAWVLNVPHNPTGWYPSHSDLRQFFTLAEKNDCVIIADEVYAGLNYFTKSDGSRYDSLASLSEQVISVGSLTKSFGLPGVRVGWIASQNPEIIELIKHQRTYSHCYTSSLSEVVACSALNNREIILERNQKIAKRNLLALEQLIRRWNHIFSYSRPCSGPVCLVRFNPSNTRFSSASELSADLLEKEKLLLVSNDLFNCSDNYFRFGFGTKKFSGFLDVFERYLEQNITSV